MEIDKEMLRWLLLIGAAPVWGPFLLQLWRDFNHALLEEGGLFGREPGRRQIERIREERKSEPELLVSEPWVRPGEQRLPRMRSAPVARTAAPQRPAPGFRSGPAASEGERPGFRPR